MDPTRRAPREWFPEDRVTIRRLGCVEKGAGQRDTFAQIVRKHLEDIGLDGDIAQIAGLSIGE